MRMWFPFYILVPHSHHRNPSHPAIGLCKLRLVSARCQKAAEVHKPLRLSDWRSADTSHDCPVNSLLSRAPSPSWLCADISQTGEDEGEWLPEKTGQTSNVKSLFCPALQGLPLQSS